MKKDKMYQELTHKKSLILILNQKKDLLPD